LDIIRVPKYVSIFLARKSLALVPKRLAIFYGLVHKKTY